MSDEKPLIDPPPSYDDAGPPDVTAAFSHLNLSETSNKPTPSQCLAHLKLLEAFHQLREDVATTDGLYGIRDDFVPSYATKERRINILAKMREKRWAIYITNASLRFERWWQNCIPRTGMLVQNDLHRSHFASVATDGKPIPFTKENLPPLDVLMVWHSYMLNPRRFFEDCIRHGTMDFWQTGLPWGAVDASISTESFAYTCSEQAHRLFETKTGLSWENSIESPAVKPKCPRCSKEANVSWTSCTSEKYWKTEDPGESGSGYADKDFRHACSSCGLILNHEVLRSQKFRRDTIALMKNDCPMPGTVLDIEGLPEVPEGKEIFIRVTQYPNQLMKKASLAQSIIEITDMRSHDSVSISSIRTLVELAVLKGSRLTRQEKVAIRRMMSCYWENSSIFSIDLVGAVIRQGSFIEKMHSIDWIHSPAALSTMTRLIEKYGRYFDIIARYPKKVAVPTLDVDLAWHTHQLCPPSYYAYSFSKTWSFIDHDDKIDENKLSDAFEWTSKTYQKMFDQVYSSCTCWYCEAIRESHTSTISRLFQSKHDPVLAELDRLHDSSTDNPHKNPHISAHNAVRPASILPVSAKVKAAELERNYQKARQRAMKKGRDPPDRDSYMYAYAYGYPLYVPYYAPYMGDPCINGGMYAANPACANFEPGAAGNCCQGTCGGGVAAGACAGTGSGGCAGGAAGGCGSGSGGAGCGGGGGGGGGGCGGGGGGGC